MTSCPGLIFLIVRVLVVFSIRLARVAKIERGQPAPLYQPMVVRASPAEAAASGGAPGPRIRGRLTANYAVAGCLTDRCVESVGTC